MKRLPIVDALGRPQEARVRAEADVLRLIVGSKLPAAERFERWVFEEVLLSIRKTGAYGAPSPMSMLNVPVALRGLVLSYTKKAIALEVEKAKSEPQAAALTWSMAPREGWILRPQPRC